MKLLTAIGYCATRRFVVRTMKLKPGRVGTGIKQAELERLWQRLQPLATDETPLEVPPPAQ